MALNWSGDTGNILKSRVAYPCDQRFDGRGNLFVSLSVFVKDRADARCPWKMPGYLNSGIL